MSLDNGQGDSDADMTDLSQSQTTNGPKTKKFKIQKCDDRFDQQFKNLGEIGAGSYGIVIKAQDKLKNELYAVKKINFEADPDYRKQCRREVKTLAAKSGDYVVQYFDSWYENNGIKDILYIQLELCSHNLKDIIEDKRNCFGGKTFQDMNPIEYFISSHLFKELLECVQYLHETKPPIMHRDLKPANILILEKPKNTRYLKLGDFGQAKKGGLDTLTHTRGVGTTDYMAPEINRPRKRYNNKVDIYSLGKIGEELFDIDFNCKKPYESNEVRTQRICLKSKIKKMCDLVYSQRPTCAHLLGEFKKWGISIDDWHKFKISKEDWNTLSSYQNKFFYQYFEAILARAGHPAHPGPSSQSVTNNTKPKKRKTLTIQRKITEFLEPRL